MRMAELSGRSGVPIPTIKFYLREGLLAAGLPRAANQADYDDTHLRRLRLVRALTELGGLGLAAVRTVLELLDTGTDRPGALGRAVQAAGGPRRGHRTPAAVAELAELAAVQGARPAPGSAALGHAADVLAALRSLDPGWDRDRLAAYAEAAWALARRDLAGGPARPEAVLARVLLGDALFAALHRLAVAATPVAAVTEIRQRQGNVDELRRRSTS